MLKKGHFCPFLALPQTSKKEAFSPPKNTKFTPKNAPKKEKFLLHSNRKLLYFSGFFAVIFEGILVAAR